jgi:hypothetical protein
MRNGAAKRASEGGNRTSLDLSMVAQRTSEFRERMDGWRETLRRETNEHPGRTTAIALGAGYLLGGGLFSPLTGRLVAVATKMAFRLALVPFISHSLVALGESLLSGSGQDDDAAPNNRNHKNNTDQKETHP